MSYIIAYLKIIIMNSLYVLKKLIIHCKYLNSHKDSCVASGHHIKCIWVSLKTEYIIFSRVCCKTEENQVVSAPGPLAQGSDPALEIGCAS